jgi:Icc-related predicted phosphoesterase
MIISDLHEHEFDGTKMPEVDVLLHCGDMTYRGEPGAYKRALEMMGTIKAELRLVIAGNHDLSLDKDWKNDTSVTGNPGMYHQTLKQQEEQCKIADEIMTGSVAREAGVVYLKEGTHKFTLKNGAKFTIYASPYTPYFCGWGFSYYAGQDRFNTAEHVASGCHSIAQNPIPSEVDIVMTHGPPHMILDKTVHGDNAGCEMLLRALGRIRPLMHCFGHIHEGHGAHLVTWKTDGSVDKPENATPFTTKQQNEYPKTNIWPIHRGQQTLMVNAAIRDVQYNPVNPPIIVALNLPRQ